MYFCRICHIRAILQAISKRHRLYLLLKDTIRESILRHDSGVRIQLSGVRIQLSGVRTAAMDRQTTVARISLSSVKAGRHVPKTLMSDRP
jgi:hypothetical protein